MLVRRHLPGMGLSHMQTLDDGMYHACYQDEQGSTAYITREDGEVENSYVYDAFGNVLERKEGVRNDILYRDQQYDQEAGQYYLRARYYNPVIGRFIQEDTYRGDGLNLYAYCGNNPVMYYDPSGHTKVTQPITEPETPMTAGEGGSPTNNYYIPRDENGNIIPLNRQMVNGRDIPLPDPEAQGRPHTVLGGATSSKTGVDYRQSATFGGGTWPSANGYDVPLYETHWYNHGRGDHAIPHKHIFYYDSSDGGWQRGGHSLF